MRGWILLAAFLTPAAFAQNGPLNLDFEADKLSVDGVGWVCPTSGYTVEVARENVKQGRGCARLASLEAHDLSAFGNLMQTWDATPYRGQRVKVRGAVRTDVSGANKAKLWLRIDLPDERTGFLDNMGRRKITHRDWQYYEMFADVPPDALTLNFGIMLIKEGQVWLDDVSVSTVPVSTTPPRALEVQQLENLTAFARLLAYVRFFHPSDGAAKVDWDAFAVVGVKAVESVRDDAELARALDQLFKPIAPTVAVWAGGAEPPLDAALQPQDASSLGLVRWVHHGVGLGNPQNIYRSERAYLNPGAPQPADFAPPEQPFRVQLVDGVACRVPLALYTRENVTLPSVAGVWQPPANGAADNGNDRATRLAAITLAWGALQQFYPYFDVIQTDWTAALREALLSAASDVNEAAFLKTLQRLFAQLDDGHAHVWHAAHPYAFTLPLTWAWVGDELVVTHVLPNVADAPGPGDVVLSIDDRPTAERRAAAERLISAATPGWRQYRLLHELSKSDRPGATKLEVRRPDGSRRTVQVQRVSPTDPPREPRPDPIAEVRPAVMYVDLDRIGDAEFLAALPKLEQAKGIVFDMRGYPSRLSTIFLQHLMSEAGTCAQWHIPVVTRPDREGMKFQFSNWPVPPLSPKLTAKIAFVTDGRAISYAETCMGIVEHYKLGAIVGQPTAGTNGNVNPFDLPGGFHVNFTGMKVLKHDGSRHHGIGISPTVAVDRTIAGIAAGKDELLEKAIEVVSQ